MTGSSYEASQPPADRVVLTDTSVWELAQKGNGEAEAILTELADAACLATCAIVAGEVLFGTPTPARNRGSCSLATRRAHVPVDVA